MPIELETIEILCAKKIMIYKDGFVYMGVSKLLAILQVVNENDHSKSNNFKSHVILPGTKTRTHFILMIMTII